MTLQERAPRDCVPQSLFASAGTAAAAVCSSARRIPDWCQICRRGCPVPVWGGGPGCQVAGNQRGTARRGLCSSAAPAAGPAPPQRTYCGGGVAQRRACASVGAALGVRRPSSVAVRDNDPRTVSKVVRSRSLRMSRCGFCTDEGSGGGAQPRVSTAGKRSCLGRRGRTNVAVRAAELLAFLLIEQHSQWCTCMC